MERLHEQLSKFTLVRSVHADGLKIFMQLTTEGGTSLEMNLATQLKLNCITEDSSGEEGIPSRC